MLEKPRFHIAYCCCISIFTLYKIKMTFLKKVKPKQNGEVRQSIDPQNHCQAATSAAYNFYLHVRETFEI